MSHTNEHLRKEMCANKKNEEWDMWVKWEMRLIAQKRVKWGLRCVTHKWVKKGMKDVAHKWVKWGTRYVAQKRVKWEMRCVSHNGVKWGMKYVAHKWVKWGYVARWFICVRHITFLIKSRRDSLIGNSWICETFKCGVLLICVRQITFDISHEDSFVYDICRTQMNPPVICMRKVICRDITWGFICVRQITFDTSHEEHITFDIWHEDSFVYDICRTPTHRHIDPTHMDSCV